MTNIIIISYIIGCIFSLIFTVVKLVLNLRRKIKEDTVISVSLGDICYTIFAVMTMVSISWCIILVFLYINKDKTIFVLNNKKNDKKLRLCVK